MKNFIQNRLILLCFCLLFLGLTNQIIAQVTDFKMGDYKYRTKGIRAIGVNVGGNSAVMTGGLTNSLSLALSPGSVYTKQYSTDKQQLEFWNWSSLNTTKPAIKESPLKWDVGTRANWFLRTYKGTNFFEIGSKSQIGVNNGQTMGENPLDSNKKKQTFYNVVINPQIAIGKGRLEYISNAQMALFILEDLKDAGKIKGTVSKELAYKFTELVTQLYNTRIFDFRVRRNYEVAKIDSFLRQNKIISATDVKTYNIIADNWNYAIQPQAIESTYDGYTNLLVSSFQAVSDRINQFGIFGQNQRYAGTRTRIVVDIPSSISNGGSTAGYGGPLGDTVKTIYTVKGLNLTGTWEKHQALSLKIQQIITVWAAAGSTSSDTKKNYSTNKPDTTETTKATNAGLGASFGYSLFPNTRTVINTFSSLSLNHNISKSGANETKTNPIMLRAMVKGSYFINYRSRISGQVELGYSTQPSTNIVGNLPMSVQKGLNFSIMFNYINYIF